MTFPSPMHQQPDDWEGAMWVGLALGIIGCGVLVVGLCHVVAWVFRLIAQAAQP